ncbi:TetR/AcrR family transcriptional regulator [Curtobacterium ammoniigenes]|uniref:TetR/AcrR family transcriptional regulator n=1 Tax=Curtobacterium ammoniigenes TaxID=395387 RepID=UPI00082EE5FD|nr:TetR/AcrR family transcriptional regulator [Curtobacterium ammoniigenes]
MANKRELQKAANRAAIIEAAGAEFARSGYAGTSIADIAAAMGRPKSAIGQHQFASKEAIAVAVIATQWERWIAMRNDLEARMPAGIERLLEFLLAAAADARANSVALGAVRLLAERNETELTLDEPPFHWIALTASEVQASIEAGTLKTDRSSIDIARTILSAGYGVFDAVNRGLRTAQADIDAALRQVWSDLLAGIDPDTRTTFHILA